MGPDITPKPELGTTYQLSDKLELEDLNRILYLPASVQSLPALMKDMALAYILVDNPRNELCPFLLPCMGWLNKAKTDIKYYHHFISGTEKQYDSFLTDDQKELNRICHDMLKLAEKMPGSLINEPVAEEEKITELFQLWQGSLPLLQHQRFLYTYRLHWKRELKGKPEKRKLERVDILPQKPQLHFHLLDRGDILQLHLRISIKGKILDNYFADHLLFVLEEGNIYLLSSLRDAAIVEWMDKLNDCITIFKEHYETFEKEILNPLREIYPVEIINSSPLHMAKPKKLII